MTKSNNDRLIPLVQELKSFAFSQQASIGIMRTLGYGLLALALFDVIEIFFPPQFMNPAWEFQTLGALVERVPVPFIGFVLVFFGELHSRSKWELLLLKLFSWLCLLCAIFFMLSIPLGVMNTVRLNNQNITQTQTLSKQQFARAKQVEQQLSQATPEQINNFLKSQGNSLAAKKPEELKTELLSQVTKAKEQIKTQSEVAQSSRGLSLLKSSVKWNLGAMVAATLFFSIWKSTSWARMN
ncbi:MAG: HpsJ family protein [Cyanomargarita calcarea GSE-NOS-MK-12-04C]|jgi:hypothetical protein|uniref:HpsJ family protein n=1 Tax=Cyanomargarita calcarea GSE-NOS-MK-12-04C TaxID=2839659 RepID=A0A951QTP7_9CYAN|nr:HpsJ family protein [Cyanomargarita calcarea GSE-NOS-MK-12-04C]